MKNNIVVVTDSACDIPDELLKAYDIRILPLRVFWKGKEKRTRRWAYEWLAGEMGLSKDVTHIGMFNVEQCKQVIQICKEARKHEQAQFQARP